MVKNFKFESIVAFLRFLGLHYLLSFCFFYIQNSIFSVIALRNPQLIISTNILFKTDRFKLALPLEFSHIILPSFTDFMLFPSKLYRMIPGVRHSRQCSNFLNGEVGVEQGFYQLGLYFN